MPLRPRYSLLTLLILTALVAGGVKYWRGPHRTVMSDSPTSNEMEILKAFDSEGYAEFFKQHGVKFRYEVESMREWEGDRIMSLKLFPTPELTLIEYDPQLLDQGKLLMTPALWLEFDTQKKQEMLTRDAERVLCLLHRGREARLIRTDVLHLPVTPSVPSRVPGKRQRHLSRPIYEPNPLYALTDQKRVYELVSANAIYVLGGKLVTLEQVVDKDLRVKIATELAQIPDPQ